MPLTPNSLIAVSTGAARPGAGAGNRTKLWLYNTDDTHAQVLAANYFNSLASRLTRGDVIIATVSMGGTQEVRVYGVRTISAGVVTIVQQIFTA